MTVGITYWVRVSWISRKGHRTGACPLCMWAILSDILYLRWPLKLQIWYINYEFNLEKWNLLILVFFSFSGSSKSYPCQPQEKAQHVGHSQRRLILSQNVANWLGGKLHHQLHVSGPSPWSLIFCCHEICWDGGPCGVAGWGEGTMVAYLARLNGEIQQLVTTQDFLLSETLPTPTRKLMAQN
jgi:hypothetical protein